MKIKLMFLPQSTYCSEGVAKFNVIIIMMIVSVEQRPGWGEHLLTEICDAIHAGPWKKPTTVDMG